MSKPYITFEELKEQEFKKDPELKELYEKEHLKFLISQELKELRKKRKYSQLELAKKIGTTQSVIARIENGNVNINLTTLSKLLSGLGATIKFEAIEDKS